MPTSEYKSSIITVSVGIFIEHAVINTVINDSVGFRSKLQHRLYIFFLNLKRTF